MALASASSVSSMSHCDSEGHARAFIPGNQHDPHVHCSAMHLNTFWLKLAVYTCYAFEYTLAELGCLHLVQAALEKEIKDTLASWQQLLARADRIFVQASVSNARPIYGGDDAALQRHDPRIRSIPFNTR